MGEARHLHDREDCCAGSVRTNRKNIHQTGGTQCECEVTLDTLSISIIDASNLVRSAGRQWSEGPEPDTVGGRWPQPVTIELRCVEGVLEIDSVISVLKRNFVSPYMGPSVDSLADRETESEKQAGGRLHLGKRKWWMMLDLGRGSEESSHRSWNGLYNRVVCLNRGEGDMPGEYV